MYHNKLVFRRPRGMRLFAGIMGLFVIVGGPVSFWYRYMDERSSGSEAVRVSCWAVMALLSIASGVLPTYLSGPEDLYLDMDSHTYRLVSGWPLFPAIRSGSWDDMAGIYVRSTSKGVFVRVSWRYNKKHTTPLGRFGSEQSAKQFAQDIASKLDLPQTTTQN